jgi:hypothetical protein
MTFWPVIEAPSLVMLYTTFVLGPFAAFYLAARLVGWFKHGL